MYTIFSKSKKTLNFNVIQEGKSVYKQLSYREAVDSEELTDQIKNFNRLGLVRITSSQEEKEQKED